MKKIFVLVLIALSLVFVNKVQAADASVSITPGSLSKNVGESFTLSVSVNGNGKKVCAVEGKLVPTKLSIRSIVVGSDLMPQTTPTTSNPSFLIGIPGCTTSAKTLITMTVAGNTSGAASMNLANLDIIGEGSSLGSLSVGGKYTISATVPAPVVAVNTNNSVSRENQNTDEAIAEENLTPENDQVAQAGAAQGEEAKNNKWLWILGAAILVAGISYGAHKAYSK